MIFLPCKAMCSQRTSAPAPNTSSCHMLILSTITAGFDVGSAVAFDIVELASDAWDIEVVVEADAPKRLRELEADCVGLKRWLLVVVVSVLLQP
jgi:hypothetical protein